MVLHWFHGSGNLLRSRVSPSGLRGIETIRRSIFWECIHGKKARSLWFKKKKKGTCWIYTVLPEDLALVDSSVPVVARTLAVTMISHPVDICGLAGQQQWSMSNLCWRGLVHRGCCHGRREIGFVNSGTCTSRPLRPAVVLLQQNNFRLRGTFGEVSSLPPQRLELFIQTAWAVSIPDWYGGVRLFLKSSSLPWLPWYFSFCHGKHML